MRALARESLGNAGVNTRGLSRDEVATRALHSTSDFPEILSAVTNKTLRQAYEAYPRTFMLFCRQVLATDFKAMHRVQLGEAPQLQGEVRTVRGSYKAYGQLLDIEQGLLHRRQVAVELRLAAQEIVHVILAAPRIPGPGRAAEYRLPVAGGGAIGLGIGPDVPVRLRIVAAGPALGKPGVLVRRVGIDLIDHHFQPARMGRRDQRVEMLQRAEDRIDRAVIGHVIAEILHRRGEERR